MAYATSYPLSTTGTPVSTSPTWYAGAGVFFVKAIGSGTAILQWSPDDGTTWYDVPESAVSAIGYKKFAVPLGTLRLKPTGSTGVTAEVAPNPGATGLNDGTAPGATTTVATAATSPASTPYQQVTGLSTAKTLTVPADATAALVTVSGQTVRWRTDATAPTSTVGMPVTATTSIRLSRAEALVIQFIETAASATLDVYYSK